MSHTTLAALIVDINRPAKTENKYNVGVLRRPEPAAVEQQSSGQAVDSEGVIPEVEKVLQANFMKGIPIEFRSKTYETIEEALEAIRTRRAEWE